MFKILRLIVIFSLLFVSSSFAADKSDIKSIINYINNTKAFESGDLELYGHVENYRGLDLEVSVFQSKENLATHDNFNWHWEMHYLIVKRVLGGNTFKLEIITKEYQEFSSPDARGFIQWSLNDFDLNGQIDKWEKGFSNKEYEIVKDGILLLPMYPEGFVNLEWYDLSLEEIQTKFDHEISYWIKIIKSLERI